ncbi:MAG: AbrB/MazE/SpoVT family DNA-binding domain-containing protein [Nostocaceae cyanobacterium]|nr:AbrB/MazE/SpoVT family DNA-binding domain-containing protein [Nostocaceae cyanobacterium]
MLTVTVTKKGYTIIPPEILNLLNLQPGDKIDFIVAEDGKVYMQPVKVNVETLKAILYKSERKAVSIEEMEEAILKNSGQMP